jgi:hypothetical protein
MTRDEQNHLLETMAGILIRCFFLSVALLIVWFIFYLFVGNWGFSISVNLYGLKLSRNKYDLLVCYGMAFIKTCAFLFFLFPYVAIKLVLRANKNKV